MCIEFQTNSHHNVNSVNNKTDGKCKEQGTSFAALSSIVLVFELRCKSKCSETKSETAHLRMLSYTIVYAPSLFMNTHITHQV